MLQEFKEFAVRGNVADMAVGIVNRLKLQEEKKPAAPPEGIALLREIRDAVKR